MKKYNYLEYYYSCMKTGMVKRNRSGLYNGLCHSIDIKYTDIELFKPTDKDCDLYDSNPYWASGFGEVPEEPLGQNKKQNFPRHRPNNGDNHTQKKES